MQQMIRPTLTLLIVCLGVAERRFQPQGKAMHYAWGSFRGEGV